MHMDIQNVVKLALAEDVGTGDISAALIPRTVQGQAQILAKEAALVCGQAWVEAVFQQVSTDLSIEWFVEEGSWQARPSVWAICKGPLGPMLTAERTALNFLQTLSAVATKTYHFCQLLKGSKTKILDTRKTIPGLRLAQKYAVRCAGADNHRFGLFDEFLIKENHIKALGSITKAMTAAQQLNLNKPIVVEVQTISEFHEARLLQPTRIMLDNFTDEMIAQVMIANTNPVAVIEVSGGIDESRILTLAQLGVDYISIGALTKSIQAIDLSLLVE